MDSSNLDNQLKVAAKKGDAATVLRLIQNQGVNIDAIYEHGCNALLWAVINNHYHVVLVLVRARANIYLETKTGKTAIYFSVLKKHDEISFLLLSAMPNKKLIELENNDFYKDIVKKFKEKNESRLVSNLDSQNIKGQTMFIASVRSNQIATVALLLDAGADIKIKDIFGHNAIDWGIKLKRVKIIELLLAWAGNTERKDITELLVKSLLISKYKESIMKLLPDDVQKFILTYNSSDTIEINKLSEGVQSLKTSSIPESSLPAITFAYPLNASAVDSQSQPDIPIDTNLLYASNIKRRKKSLSFT